MTRCRGCNRWALDEGTFLEIGGATMRTTSESPRRGREYGSSHAPARAATHASEADTGHCTY
jgi:hypothetical protein